MSMTRLSRTLTKTNRSDIRYEVINWFLDENAGTGVGKNATSYYYTVETYDEYTIELHRPVSLNKGFDFEFAEEYIIYELYVLLVLLSC